MSKKLTKERTERICQALRLGATYAIAAEAGGIVRNTLYVWIRKGEQDRAREPYKTFAKKIREAESSSAVACLHTIQNTAKEDWKAAAWLLSRRFGYKNDATHTLPAETKAAKRSGDILDYREILETQISELRTSMDKAKESGSWQAYAALQRQLVSLMQELRALDAEEGAIDAHDRMTDEQLLSEIVNTIISLPPLLRQRVQSDLHSLAGSNVVALKKGS